MRNHALRAIALLFFCFAMAACQPKKDWQLYDVSGHLPGLQFSLLSDEGKTVSAADYRGRVVLLYFGFTGCSSQCPLTLTRLKEAQRQLGPAARFTQILFVTIDPDHDTPSRLQHYISAFSGASITGLTGRKADIEAFAKRYRIAIPDADPQDDITHSNTVFIFDQAGHARLLLTPDEPQSALIHDLRLLTP